MAVVDPSARPPSDFGASECARRTEGADVCGGLDEIGKKRHVCKSAAITVGCLAILAEAAKAAR